MGQHSPLPSVLKQEVLAAEAGPTDGKHRDTEVEDKREFLGTGVEQGLEEVRDERGQQDGKVIHHHDEGQCQGGLGRRGGVHRLVVDERLDDAVAQAYQYAARHYHPLRRRNPYQQQAQGDGQEAVELCTRPEKLHDTRQDKAGSHDGKEEEGNHQARVSAGEVVGFHQEGQVEGDRQYHIRSESVEPHQLQQVGNVDAVFAGNDDPPEVCLGRVHVGGDGGYAAIGLEMGAEQERHQRQEVDHERQVPVDFRQVARDGCGNDERDVGEGGAVAELAYPVLAREVARNQPGGQRDYQPGTDAEQCADRHQLPHP